MSYELKIYDTIISRVLVKKEELMDTIINEENEKLTEHFSDDGVNIVPEPTVEKEINQIAKQVPGRNKRSRLIKKHRLLNNRMKFTTLKSKPRQVQNTVNRRRIYKSSTNHSVSQSNGDFKVIITSCQHLVEKIKSLDQVSVAGLYENILIPKLIKNKDKYSEKNKLIIAKWINTSLLSILDFLKN